MSHPKLRFKEFSGAWEPRSLAEITSTFKSGSGITSENIYEAGDYPVYGGNGLRGYTNMYTHDGSYALIGRQGALCGNIKFVSGKNFISEHAIAVQGNDKASTSWLAIKLHLMNLNRLSESSAQPGLAVNKLLDLKIKVPSLPEQEKIAEFITTVDKSILILQKKEKLLQTHKEGVMRKIFSRELKIRDDSGSSYPEWIKTTLGEISSKISAGATPSTGKKEYWNGDIRWMNSGELNLKRVYEVSNRITELGLKNSSTKMVPKYSVLVGLAGQGKTRGTVAINYVDLCTNQSIAAIQPNFDKFIPEYIYQNLNSRYQELRAMSTGEGGRGGLNLEIIKSVPIALPSLAEQEKIAEFFMALDAKIQNTHDQLELAGSYKQGLLQQMFI